MSTTNLKRALLFIASSCIVSTGFAEPVTYPVDPSHTFPAFEADHWAGLSVWRGKINETSGTLILDKEAQTGSIDVTMNMESIDFGFEPMNERTRNDILHTEQYPTSTYTGTLVNYENGNPTAVEGELTLHGVTKPVNLTINQFKCQPHFRHGREVCGADATVTINRADFGIDYDLQNGFFPEVNLLITVEAGIPE
ncbi:MAG TPA: polyisoprenoid-binding protein [Gammaproteobacteria bacterium]|jgi:polyisoprenoid-binding protein YceI|nr:polyisoprenoid-binding protein [Pseudomonadota bacterium]HAY45285.1 polyisoprenoid-binding protein [Gammaproteobacteria bacterium]